MLGSEITRHWGRDGPARRHRSRCGSPGSAGQSFGAFIPPGLTLELEGDTNDYVGKGLSGGRIVVRPPAESPFKAPRERDRRATSRCTARPAGEAFIRGVAGERFAVRNSGATAVVEGVGDHGCEYMTGGRVLVIGQDRAQLRGRACRAAWPGCSTTTATFAARCNTEMVGPGGASPTTPRRQPRSRATCSSATATSRAPSARRSCSSDWSDDAARASSGSSRTTTAACSRRRRGCGPSGMSVDEAEMAAFEENARDLARVGRRLMGKPDRRSSRSSAAASPRGRRWSGSTTGARRTPGCPTASSRDQGARCMDCGIPFCHTGVLISGMASGCPINNLIPEWNDLVYRGQWREASIRLHRTNNFPEFTGPRLPGAVRGVVHGRAQRRPGGDQDDRAGDRRPRLGRGLDHAGPAARADGALGSRSSAPGPPGLAAADQLNQAGPPRDGVRAGRAHRRPADVRHPEHEAGQGRRRRAASASWRRRASTFRTGVTVGADIAADELQAEFDAVVLATGATVARDLAGPRPRAGRHPPRDELPARQHPAAARRRGGRRGADRRRGQGRARHRRRRHRHGLRRDGDPAGRAERAPARAARPAAARARARTTRGPSGRRSTSWTTGRRRRRRCGARTRAATPRRPAGSSAATST